MFSKKDTRIDTSTTYKESSSRKIYGFEKDLNEKQQFYLYFYAVCPSIEIINILWKMYQENKYNENLEYYESVCPFKDHPSGLDSIFPHCAGFIDPDIFLEYYAPRENYLISIQFVGHPDFICQYSRPKERLEESVHYFDTLINEHKIKLTKLKKVKILEMIIEYLSKRKFSLSLDQIMRYLLSFFNMYKDMKVLHAHSLAVDCNFELCRFE